MTKIYSYILRDDDGAAPNPFWGVCTLAICKPAIRRNAHIGDWIIGTGSKNAKLRDSKIYDFSDSIVYAMKMSDVKTFIEYDHYCKKNKPNKIPNCKSRDWRLRVGDCIYKYSESGVPELRSGVHSEGNMDRDLRGLNILISDRFYYFGTAATQLPIELHILIKKDLGHKKIENIELIANFENWISQFELNKIYAKPQMYWLFDSQGVNECLDICRSRESKVIDDGLEETVC